MMLHIKVWLVVKSKSNILFNIVTSKEQPHQFLENQLRNPIFMVYLLIVLKTKLSHLAEIL